MGRGGAGWWHGPRAAIGMGRGLGWCRVPGAGEASGREGDRCGLGTGDERPTAFPYSVDARRVVATLWHYQQQLFGEDSARRWGFGVGIGARDYGPYRDGVGELADAGLVHVDPRGLGCLRNEGMRFCGEHRAILDAEGPFYTQFAPTPSGG